MRRNRANGSLTSRDVLRAQISQPSGVLAYSDLGAAPYSYMDSFYPYGTNSCLGEDLVHEFRICAQTLFLIEYFLKNIGILTSVKLRTPCVRYFISSWHIKSTYYIE